MAKSKSGAKAPGSKKAKKEKKGGQAKKPAATAKGGADDEKPEAPKFRSPMQQINENDLHNLLRRVMSQQKQAQEINGSAAEQIKNAVEKKNLERGAFAWIKSLVGMSPEKRETRLASFDHYREMCADLLGETEETKNPSFGFARQELGEKEPGAGKQTAKPDGEKDLRPASMRTPAEGGTRADEDNITRLGRGRTAAGVDDLKRGANVNEH